MKRYLLYVLIAIILTLCLTFASCSKDVNLVGTTWEEIETDELFTTTRTLQFTSKTDFTYTEGAEGWPSLSNEGTYSCDKQDVTLNFPYGQIKTASVSGKKMTFPIGVLNNTKLVFTKK